LALLLHGQAAADVVNDWIWAKAPQRGDLIAAYPPDAAKAEIGGSVKLRCTADVQGGLQHCAVREETPAGKGFGAAALSIAPALRVDPMTADGQSVRGDEVEVPVDFQPAVLHGGPALTVPQWLRQPSRDDAVHYFPAEARGLAGHVTLEGAVTIRGALDRCEVKAETPAGRGFGAAALSFASLFIMRPMTRDGLPVGGAEVIIPIVFAAQTTTSQNIGSIRVLRTAPWIATPTLADMASAFPKGAMGRIPSARVILRCEIERDGRVDACDTVEETPEHQGFGQAARGLAKDFRVATVGIGDKWGMPKVDVPFDFRDPSATEPPVEIYQPVWRTPPRSNTPAGLYPDTAVKAGIKEGGAELDCTALHDGSLSGCTVKSETAAGFGFGEAAIKLAATAAVNPWTSAGTPVDGAHVEFSIRLQAPDPPGMAKP